MIDLEHCTVVALCQKYLPWYVMYAYCLSQDVKVQNIMMFTKYRYISQITIYSWQQCMTRYWNTGQSITWENTNFNILLLESSQSLCSCVCIYSNKPCYSLAFTWLHACITWYIQLMSWFQTLKNRNKSFKWALITYQCTMMWVLGRGVYGGR